MTDDKGSGGLLAAIDGFEPRLGEHVTDQIHGYVMHGEAVVAVEYLLSAVSDALHDGQEPLTEQERATLVRFADEFGVAADKRKGM